MLYFLFFFFSSRRRHTRLQGDWSSTCALPISVRPRSRRSEVAARLIAAKKGVHGGNMVSPVLRLGLDQAVAAVPPPIDDVDLRSEERRVGTETGLRRWGREYRVDDGEQTGASM